LGGEAVMIEHPSGRSHATSLLFGLAVFFAVLQLATAWIEPYGLFHDELYYWAGSRRLGLGYVDHPPLSVWVLAGATALLGDGPLGFRLVPSLCCVGTVLLTGHIARRLGAGTFGRLLAGLCVALMPFTLVLFSFYSVNALEILLWTAATCVLVELVRTGDERLWLGIGAIAGLGLLNKHTFALLAAGMAVGVVATPLRAQLRSRWLWVGAAVALTLAMPNLAWNAWNDWPSLAFYRSRPAADLPATVLEALELQILGANPANLLVWVPGVVFLLFSKVVLAAGATFWDQWRGRWHTSVRIALTGGLLAFGSLVVPATLPILPPQAVAEYFEAIGEKPEIEISDVGQGIPLYFAGRLWAERFADEVVKAWDVLPPGEQKRAVVLAPHWVFASAVEYYGRDRQLGPVGPVVAPHNAYWFWRDDAAGRDVVLAVAIPPEVLARYFAETREVGEFRCEYCATFGPGLPIVVASRPLRPLEDLLSEWRHFSIESSPQLQ
jgi:hypothetical protein